MNIPRKKWIESITKAPANLQLAKQGYIYIVQSDNPDYYKIGLSKQPHKRFKRLGDYAGQSFKSLDTYHLITTNNMEASEKVLHAMFYRQNIQNELFKLKRVQFENLASVLSIEWSTISAYDWNPYDETVLTKIVSDDIFEIRISDIYWQYPLHSWRRDLRLQRMELVQSRLNQMQMDSQLYQEYTVDIWGVTFWFGEGMCLWVDLIDFLRMSDDVVIFSIKKQRVLYRLN